ncbi:MAG: NAD(P)/FAD-dependent oxidoreductase [Chloroflexota bacterium]
MNIAIIGAGIAGMSAAYDLARAGHKVTIYEAGDQVGGLASGFKEPHWDWSVEKYYHHWFASDKHMLELIEELGLSHKVLFPRPYTVLLHNDRWYPFDSILQALLFPGLGWGLDKIRFGFVGLYLRLTKNWPPLEKITAHEWMLKWVGRRVYEKMWQPLLIGKFGPYYKEVPMAWFWARLHVRTTRLGTYQGGFQAFCDDFVEILRGLGVEIYVKTSVRQIRQSDENHLLCQTDRRPTTDDRPVYDKVLVTTSPALMATLAPDLPEDYLCGLLNSKSMGAVVLTLALKHRLSEQGYYWYNIPKSAGYPFLALVEHTNFVSPEHFGGDHIVYCGDYLEADHEYFDLTQDELLEHFIPALKRFNPKFERGWINKTWLHRTRYAQPVPLLDHSQNIPPIATPIAGLYFASMSQVYPWDRGTNFAVEIGRRAASMMVDS